MSPTVVATRNGSPLPSSAENGKSTAAAAIEKEDGSYVNGEGEQTEQDQEYVEAVKRLEKVKVPARDDEHWRKILEEDDETSKRLANSSTQEEIRKEIEIILGPSKDWSSNSEEVQTFRETVKKIQYFEKSERKSEDREAFLPPVFLSVEPINPNELNKKILINVNCTLHGNKAAKTVECDYNTSADDFAELFLNKLNTAHQQKRKKEDWVFKAAGTAEYMYGDYKMAQFDHIRKCMKKGVKPTLTLLDKETVKAELDPRDVTLKTVSYDFKHEKDPKLYVHEEICYGKSDWSKMKHISLWDLVKCCRVKLIGVDNLVGNQITQPDNTYLYFCCELYHGGTPLSRQKFSKMVPFNRSPRWNQTIVFDEVLISDIPRETKLCLTLFARDVTTKNASGKDPLHAPHHVSSKDIALGYTIKPLINFKGFLNQGDVISAMWPNDRAKPISVVAENTGSDETPIVVSYQFDRYALPVVFPQGRPPKKMAKRLLSYEQKLSEHFKESFVNLNGIQLDRKLNEIISKDPLEILKDEEKYLLWANKERIMDIPKALPKFILSVPWKMPQAVFIAHTLIQRWKPMTPVDALELLDYNFADEKVRQYAVERLNELGDVQLSDFLLQLVQTLKYELYHDSSLARFLLQRGLRSTHIIGHILFWHLKAEMHVPYAKERHGLLLEEYLLNSGGHRRELLKQSGVLDQLLEIAIKIKHEKKATVTEALVQHLQTLRQPPKYKLPLSPRMEVIGIIPEKCRVMDSAKRPLWLCFKNADETGDDLYVMFKAGDDLRQDLLTLQVLRVMDQLWKKEGLDLHMQPYGCICTGYMTGMIEIVLNSQTIANVTKKRAGVAGAFKQDPIYKWLKEHNNDEEWDTVVNNFVHSCAGYCSATYVLGIGDRHNDNIMITKKGDLFHIDFGHFLGHFKTFAGLKRETTPFVFTPMYAYVMGGENSEMYEKFSDLGCRAYNILRKYGHMIMTLFTLMLGTGIPELSSIDDVLWLRKCLILNVTNEEADNAFREKIKESLGNIRARINDGVHILAHRK
ncbi:hypothetical protein C9374_014432 [Naegleria lovaniensis]|uniref:phosphatidylinositol 3-kinase n=1 Tax=Naegleria lovaniensis TaxID=51637 RepID=A0AA88GUC2_NAELO|nr:uncharacterized protein C9374_014432 [Naegleria lovaniensis]KAG2389032.1 hypothetical protein C9374_014432 [Naegleria lovaniensis]